MTPNDRPMTLTPDELSQALSDLAMTSRPAYRDDLFRRTANTRQRPAWTFIERWLPMSFVNARHSTAPPLRAAWTLLLVAALTVVLVAGLALAGSLLLRQDRPDQLNGLVPSLVDDDSWDPSAVAGLSVPMGLDVGPDGNLYVANTGTNEVLVLDPSGAEVRRWGGTGNGEGQFIFQRDPSSPLDALGGVAVSADGIVYVTDTANDRVQAFSSDGRFLSAWGGHGAQDGRFLEPTDVAAGPDGTVFVVDDLRDDIQQFSSDGVWIDTIGRHGAGDGELDFTGGISVGPGGVLVNADYGNGRVQAWDADGTYLWSKGHGTDAASLRNPGDVDVDDEGRVIVADEAGIKIFTDGPQAASRYVMPMSPGPSVAAGEGGVVYVAAPSQRRIHRLRIEMQEPPEQASAAAAAPPGPTAQAMGPTAQAIPTSAAAAGSPPSPVPGGPQTLITDTVFAIPFSALLPSTLPEPGGHPGWWRQDLMPGVVSFQYVRDAEKSPAYVTLYLVEGVYADPCHPDDGLATSEEPSVDELAEALTHQVRVRATAASEITFGEHRGLTFDLANSIDTRSCADTTWLPQWTYRAGGPESDEITDSGGLPNSHQRIAIVDVEGVPVLIESWEIGANREEVLQADALFESIRFE